MAVAVAVAVGVCGCGCGWWGVALAVAVAGHGHGHVYVYVGVGVCGGGGGVLSCLSRCACQVLQERCMCWKHAPSKMYAACVELDIRPNSLRSLILRFTVSLEKGGV